MLRRILTNSLYFVQIKTVRKTLFKIGITNLKPVLNDLFGIKGKVLSEVERGVWKEDAVIA